MWTSLNHFLSEAGSRIADDVAKRCRPRAGPETSWHPALRQLIREPLPSQAVVIQGMTDYLSDEDHGFLYGEMGTGKSLMTLAILHLLRARNLKCRNWLIVCPPHLISTWVEEAWKTLPSGSFRTILVGRISRGKKEDRSAEVRWNSKSGSQERIPGTDFPFSELKSRTFRRRFAQDERLSIWIVSRETLKLGSAWRFGQQTRRTPLDTKVAIELGPGRWKIGPREVVTFQEAPGRLIASRALTFTNPDTGSAEVATETSLFQRPEEWIKATGLVTFSLSNRDQLKGVMKANLDGWYPARFRCPVSGDWLDLKGRARMHGNVPVPPSGAKTAWDHRLQRWVSTRAWAPESQGSRFVANWQTDELGIRRESLSQFITRFLPGFFSGVVLDEGHEFNNVESAQGLAALKLSQVCKKSLTLTGTATNGTATSLWTPFFRISPPEMRRQGFGISRDRSEEEGIRRFSETYGVVERITRIEKTENRQSRGAQRTMKRLLPGIVPAIHALSLGGRLLVERSAFITLDMVSSALPRRTQEVILVKPDPELEERGQQIQDDFRKFCDLWKKEYGSKPLLQLPMILTNQFDVPDLEVEAKFGDHTISSHQALDAGCLYAKELAYVSFLRAEAAAGRQVLTYLNFVNKGVMERLTWVLEQEGIQFRKLLSDEVPARDRKSWFSRLGDIQTVLVNPACIQTGLTLLDFPTIAVYQSGFNVITQKQAEGRPYRIGAQKDVRIAYFAYENTIQSLTLDIMGQRRAALEAFQGIFSAELFTGGEGQKSMMELGRMLIDNRAVTAAGDTWRRLAQNCPALESKSVPAQKGRHSPKISPIQKSLFEI